MFERSDLPSVLAAKPSGRDWVWIAILGGLFVIRPLWHIFLAILEMILQFIKDARRDHRLLRILRSHAGSIHEINFPGFTLSATRLKDHVENAARSGDGVKVRVPDKVESFPILEQAWVKRRRDRGAPKRRKR
jgi:hypothetical protein